MRPLNYESVLRSAIGDEGDHKVTRVSSAVRKIKVSGNRTQRTVSPGVAILIAAINHSTTVATFC